MRSLQTIQKLSQIGKILSRIAFVLAVVGFCGCLAGLLSLRLGGQTLKLGGVTLHGLVSERGGSLRGVAAALCGWAVICAGEAVLARFAEQYFRHELAAGTPFTLPGARELLGLGILTLALPTGCAVAGRILEGIAAGLMQAEPAAMDLSLGNEASIVLGIMFLIGSLLCRLGAEQNAAA